MTDVCNLRYKKMASSQSSVCQICLLFFFFPFLFSPFCFILPKLLWFTEQATAKMNHYSMFEIMKWKN